MMAASDKASSDDSLYPIAVLIDELKNEDIQVRPIIQRFQTITTTPIFPLISVALELNQKIVNHCIGIGRGAYSH